MSIFQNISPLDIKEFVGIAINNRLVRYYFVIRFIVNRAPRQISFKSIVMHLAPGMKEHACSRSFMFAVFDIFAGTRVRVRSCSIFFAKSVFVFVHVRPNTNEHACSLSTCSCSFIPALRALFGLIVVTPPLKPFARYHS